MPLIFPFILHCVKAQYRRACREAVHLWMRAAAVPCSYMSALQNELQVIHIAGDVSVTQDSAAGI